MTGSIMDTPNLALVLKELRNLKQQVLSLRTENMEAKTTIDRLEAKVETMQVDVDRKLDMIIKLTKTAHQSKRNTSPNPLSVEADGPKFPLKTMEMVAEMEERYDSDEVFQFKLDSIFKMGILSKEVSFRSWFDDIVINAYSIDGRVGRIKVRESRILTILKANWLDFSFGEDAFKKFLNDIFRLNRGRMNSKKIRAKNKNTYFMD